MGSFSERVLSLTQDKLVPKVVDNIINSSVLASRVMRTAKAWSGETLRRPIKVSNSGLGGSFFGLDTFSTSTSETTQRLAYDIRGFEQPVVIPGIERSVNSVSETQVVDLVKFKLEEAELEAADAIGGLLYGDGTGNSSKDFLGLGAIVDDGTDVGTIGGLSRTTFTVLNATRTASGGTLTLAKMATLHSAISAGSTQGHSPTMLISDPTVWDLFETLLTPTVRETYTMFGSPTTGATGGLQPGRGLEGMGGMAALSYKGIPFLKDEKATAQTMYMLNENYLDWYGLRASAVDYSPVNLGTTTMDSVYNQPPMSQFHGFNWSGLQLPTNQFGEVGHLVVLGNLISWQPRRHGRLTGITGV
ncbi:hypothetical protein LCGC14_0615470 [marine sediment metagenome]|uniref:Major capsid protein n=1 Tax=marine sediment metagenome TaxID=412755 RepID=A0A0F9RQQ5_9ZZZZ|nr:phage major capsid protein [bacterium]